MWKLLAAMILNDKHIPVFQATISYQTLLLFTQKNSTTSPLHSESGTPLLSQSFFPIKHFSPHSKRKWQKLLQPILQNPF
jgi:hypothetical protein